MEFEINFLTTNLLGMSLVDQIQLGSQFYLGEEHQYRVKIEISVAVSFNIKKKIKVDQGHFSKLM